MAAGDFNKVFGIGLGRTGTRSLASALNHLGVPTIHFPEDETTFGQLRRADFRLKILDSYQGVCDIPVAPYYAQLDQLFPGSKFVLTVREDPEAWLTSVEKLWHSIEDIEEYEYSRFVHAAVYGTLAFSRDRFRWVYNTHVTTVRHYFADRPDDFLELNICGGAGWSSLAPFLRRDTPSTPFPHDDILRIGLDASEPWRGTMAELQKLKQGRGT